MVGRYAVDPGLIPGSSQLRQKCHCDVGQKLKFCNFEKLKGLLAVFTDTSSHSCQNLCKRLCLAKDFLRLCTETCFPRGEYKRSAVRADAQQHVRLDELVFQMLQALAPVVECALDVLQSLPLR